MPLLSKVKDIFKGGSSAKKKKTYHNVLLENPEEYWQIIGELGDGAYGKVYKAQHLTTGLLAALKQVLLEGDDDLETFMIEIDILSECKHPNVVELLEAYHYDGKLWMYLEYCDGGAVDSIMVDLDRGLTEPQIAFLCRGLCNALSYIHSQKIIHRDLKAGNVLLTMDGGVKLADFGVSAKNKNTWDKRSTFIGTPYWLAPEVILCETFIDANYNYKADIWSLGIALIEFAQMDPPNHEVSPVRVMLKIQKSDPPKLDYPSRWSKEFNDFISKCLTKNPEQRPSSDELLMHPFLLRDLDLKPIRDLLLEYKADVVEEDVEDDSEEQDHTRSSTACNSSIYNSSQYDRESLMSVDKDSIVPSNEDKLPSPTEQNKEIGHLSSERRMSKGPAPLPPSANNNINHPSPKKGPAPRIPATTAPSSVIVDSLTTSASQDTETSSTTVSPVNVVVVATSPSDEQTILVQPENINVPIHNLVNSESTSTSAFIEDSKDSPKRTSLLIVDDSESKEEELELKDSEEDDKLLQKEHFNDNIIIVSQSQNEQKDDSNLDDVSSNINIVSNSTGEDISSISVTHSVIPLDTCIDKSPPRVSPEPSEVLLASISSEGTVIVRTPTPTQSDTNYEASQTDNVVTYSVTEEVPKPLELDNRDLPSPLQDTSEEYSLPEAEAQAVFILESAIESAMDTSLKYSDDGFSSPSSLTEDSLKEPAKDEVIVVASEEITIDAEEGDEGDALLKSAHKLDESEVLISNSSILQAENTTPEEQPPRSRFELTLEEVNEADVFKGDENNISIIAIKEEETIEKMDSKNMSMTIEGTTIESTDVDELENTARSPTPIAELNDVKKPITTSSEDDASDTGSPEGTVKTKPHELENVPSKPIHNGVKRQNSRSSERSDSDTTSTVGSDKENRLRQVDGDLQEEVTFRNPARKQQGTTHLLGERNANTEERNQKNKELQESLALRKKTRKRTRKFVIDGVTFTTTTSKVIYGDDEDTSDLAAAHHARRQELRELKRVQRGEQKQFQELGVKANLARQEQEKKFENEKTTLIRNYDSQIENLTRQQKQLVEKAEAKQEAELKTVSKKTRNDQEKELKTFRESLKQEWKLLKQEIELLSKESRKEVSKIRKEHLEKDQMEREKAFIERLNECHELTLKRLSDKHRKHIALKERQFLEEKHQHLRARESALWDMEERQIQDKHQLAKEQLKDIYFLQRYQMAIRHNVEQEQVKRLNQQKEDVLLKRQQSEKRQLPKRIRQEMKTREKMFREQIRISMTHLPSQEQEKEQMRKFQEQEKIKYDKERKRAEMKHRKKFEELQASNEASINELIHLQNEKGKLLTEHETYKLKSLDEEYQKELREWKSNLAPRKQKLEDGFERELLEQEKFYRGYLERGISLSSTHSSVSLTRSNNS